DTEIRADLIAQHAADAVLLVGRVHRKPADPVRGLAPGEDVHRTDVEAEAARLAHLLADHDVPAAGRALRRLLLSLEQGHRASRKLASSRALQPQYTTPWQAESRQGSGGRRPPRRLRLVDIELGRGRRAGDDAPGPHGIRHRPRVIAVLPRGVVDRAELPQHGEVV